MSTTVSETDRQIAQRIDGNASLIARRPGWFWRTTPEEVASVRSNRDQPDALRMWAPAFVELVFKVESEVA